MKGNLAVARRGGSIELNGMWRDQCPSVCHWYRVGCWIYSILSAVSIQMSLILPSTVDPSRLLQAETRRNRSQTGARSSIDPSRCRTTFSLTRAPVFPGSSAHRCLRPEATPPRVGAHRHQHTLARETRRAPADRAPARRGRAAQLVVIVPRAFESRFFSSCGFGNTKPSRRPHGSTAKSGSKRFGSIILWMRRSRIQLPTAYRKST